MGYTHSRRSSVQGRIAVASGHVPTHAARKRRRGVMTAGGWRYHIAGAGTLPTRPCPYSSDPRRRHHAHGAAVS